MKVKARHNFAFKGKQYRGNEIFDISEQDYPRLQRDVYKLSEVKKEAKAERKSFIIKRVKKYRDKQIKSSTNK